MKAHFIGISGAGMSATAFLLKEKGFEITGSDEGFYPPVSDYLQKAGIFFTPHYAKENIPTDADFIVIGKHAKLTPEENEEVKEAFESGISVRSFPEVLAEISFGTENILVCGSYGKSTTTALIAWALICAQKDPSFFIGAIPQTPSASSHAGSGNLFVLEGDEYPTSNFDPVSKFLHFKPQNVLITSLEHDHVNVFPTFESYLSPFRELLEKVPKNGLIVIAAEALKANVVPEGKHTATYGLSEGDWQAKNINWGEKTSFDLAHKDTTLVRVETSLLGEHNIENIVGAGALLLEKKLVTPEQFTNAMSSFKTLGRRLDLKSERTTVKIFEGFGSSYAKAKSAIGAMKKHFPHKRLFIVFEPHTFSWRNREALPWYDDIFKDAAQVFIYKPPLHGSATHEQLSLSEIVERVKSSGTETLGFENGEEGLSALFETLKADDAVLLLSSGDLGGLITDIPKIAEEKYPV